ncbi:MAG: M64 family metallopeptidase [Planctomycetota bacterium]
MQTARSLGASAAAVALASIAALSVAHPGAHHQPIAEAANGPEAVQPGMERLYYDFVRPDGTLDGGFLDIPLAEKRLDLPTPGVVGPAHKLDADGFEPVLDARTNGRTVAANRIEIVFVGDGYTAAELGLYADQVTAFSDDMFQYEPLNSYRPLFEIYRVDVVSNESGVDNDPTQGINRDTALDMTYWCNNIERLLCVSVSKAYSYANTAPGVDQVIAIANSSKYGGAGYPGSDLGTAAAGNGAAAQIIIHEFGHSLGNLADEYTYGGPSAWPGGEPFDVNLSTFTAGQLLDMQKKWWRWVGETLAGFDSPVNAYQGGGYSVTGVYRPTNNSMMRNLGRPFNLPGAEAIIRQIYITVSVVDGHTPTSPNPESNATLSVDTVDPLIDTIEVRWAVNGAPVGGDTDTLDLAGVGAQPGDIVTATVTDETPWVRDEAIRDTFMTEVISWTLTAPDCPADITTESSSNGVPDGLVTLSDFSYYLSLWSTGAAQADITATGACVYGTGGDGVDLSDFSCYLATWSAGCP